MPQLGPLYGELFDSPYYARSVAKLYLFFLGGGYVFERRYGNVGRLALAS